MRTFMGLQIADVVTTLIFLSMGIAESNPLAGYLMGNFGSLPGLLILKGGAVGIALLCNRVASPRFIRRINYVYMAIVVTNILTIVHGVRAGHIS
jgi:hypothetical protein